MWIYQDELAQGIVGLPRMSATTQYKKRKAGLLKYIKVDMHIVYKKEWIEEYLESLEKKQIETKRRDDDL